MEQIFNSESDCLIQSPFKTKGMLSNDPVLETYGSKDFFTRVLEQLHIFRELYLDSVMGHGLGQNTSGFGINFTTQKEVQVYIIKRAATFFQAIIIGISGTLESDTTIHKTFVDCCNVRKKNQTQNHDCNTNDCP